MASLRRSLPVVLSLAAALCVTPRAPGQDTVRDEQGEPVDVSSLPAPVRLGVRVEQVRRNLPVADAVMIVSEPTAYAEAIANWSIERRWPVLLDDGTDRSRENIARFIRAFEPSRVVRWTGSGRAWPDEPEKIREIVSESVARAWGAPNYIGLPARFSALGFAPPGIVALSALDPAWPAGLALAAGHGQIVLWTETEPTDLSGTLDHAVYQALDSRIQDSLAATGLDWNRTGDTIDAVTLALNLPPKLETANGIVALTDAIGRFDGQLRYAWAGQITGTQSEAAYRAMCALFLQPSSAWLFNAYEPKEGFAAYSVGDAAEYLRSVGLTVDVDDYPASGLPEWRKRSARAVDAGLINVNTSGQRRFFELPGGRADAGEIPSLRRPALVHFIHSFSAQNVADVASIAPRWMDSGAYAYVGSVDEPTLAAFVRPNEFVQRMFAPAPLAAAARVSSPAWKIAVFGDPLHCFGPRAERVTPASGFETAVDLEDELARHREAGRRVPVARILSMLGRDADLIGEFRSAMEQNAEDVPPELADAALWAFIRSGLVDGVHEALPRMSRPGRSDQATLDAIWQALRASLEAPQPDNRAVAALMTVLRKRTYADDASAVADAARRLYGPAAARAVIERALESAPNARERERLQDALRNY